LALTSGASPEAGAGVVVVVVVVWAMAADPITRAAAALARARVLSMGELLRLGPEKNDPRAAVVPQFITQYAIAKLRMVKAVLSIY
jgi:hypothetical protein